MLIAGITGDVNIDENGDRIADYSLLDMDPETSKFEVIINYLYAKNYYGNSYLFIPCCKFL